MRYYVMLRRELKIRPTLVNGLIYQRLIIDPHMKKHAEITEEILRDLVFMLSGVDQWPEGFKESFTYFVTWLELEEKTYRLVWLLERDQDYIGVITAFRDKKGLKNGISK